jgi:hypothetical protein
MVPFLLMLIVLSLSWGLGVLGVSVLTSWQLDASLALGVMFLFTAVSRFAPMKEDLTSEARKADTWYNRSQPCRK